MRHSVKSKPGHIALCSALVSFLYLTVLLTVGGCGKGDATDEKTAALQTAPAPLLISSDPALRPVITCDVTATNAWLDLARDIAAGDSLDVSRYRDLLATPAYRMIDDNTRKGNLSPRFVKHIMYYVFTRQDETDATAPGRKAVLNSYMYLRDHLDEVAGLNRDYFSPKRLNELRDILTTYAPAEEWPPTISIEFLAGQPLISFREPNRFAIDAGLALSGGLDQTAGLLAGRMYQTLARVDGVKPDYTENNSAKLAGAFRLLRHSAISAWLSDKPNIHFDGEHEHLPDQPRGEEVLIEDAVKILTRTVSTMNNMLAPRLDANIEKFGSRVHVLYGFNDRYEKVGWAMAKLIVAHHGEKKLRAVAANTPEFLKAYQEAALAGGAGDGLDRLPAFPEDMFEDLLYHLTQY